MMNGLSNPRVINRNGLSVAKISSLSSVSAESLSKAFAHHLEPCSVLVTDRNVYYYRLSLYSEDHELRLIQVKGGHSKVLFNIQRINTYHCQLLKNP